MSNECLEVGEVVDEWDLKKGKVRRRGVGRPEKMSRMVVLINR